MAERTMAAFDGKRWEELRDRRRRKEKLSRDEKLEWHELDAARGLVRAQARVARARELSRRRLNSIRMELGTIAVESRLQHAPRDRLRQVLESLACELDAEDGTADRTGPPETAPTNPDEERILAAVAAIPAGAVTTYGRIAEKAGLPGRALVVSRVLAAFPDTPGWYRVVNSRGRIRTAAERGQRDRLEAEGVGFVFGGVDLDRFLQTDGDA